MSCGNADTMKVSYDIDSSCCPLDWNTILRLWKKIMALNTG